MFSFLKERSKSIADNILATLIVWGGGIVISLIAARSAFFFGLPLFVVIIIGVSLFCLLMLGLYLGQGFLGKRRTKKTGETDKAIETLKAKHQSEIDALRTQKGELE